MNYQGRQLLLPGGIFDPIRAIKAATLGPVDGRPPIDHEVLTAVVWACAAAESIRALNPNKQFPFLASRVKVDGRALSNVWLQGLYPIRNAALHGAVVTSRSGFSFPVSFPLAAIARWSALTSIDPWPEMKPAGRQRVNAHRKYHEGRPIADAALVLHAWAVELEQELAAAAPVDAEGQGSVTRSPQGSG